MRNGCLEPAFERRDLAIAIARITTDENSLPQAGSDIGKDSICCGFQLNRRLAAGADTALRWVG